MLPTSRPLNSTLPASGARSPRMVRSSTDLPAPEPPMMPNTSLVHLHADAVVHQLLAEAVDHTAHLQQRAHQMSSSMNSTANKASTRITKKIDCTTASVVSRPSSRDEPCTRMPQ